MFLFSSALTSARHMYLAHNTGVGVHPGQGENKGEIMLFHRGPNPWYGQAVSSTINTVTVRTDGLIDGKPLAFDDSTEAAGTGPIVDPFRRFFPPQGQRVIAPGPDGTSSGLGMYASVVGGRGIGQVREILSTTSNTLAVTPAWRVPPDATSKIVLGYIFKDIVIYDNSATAFPNGDFSNSGASQLVDFDGNSWFNVADRNTVHRSYGAATVGAASISQSAWNEITDNQFTDLIGGGMSLIYWPNYRPGTNTRLLGPATLGNVFRRNTVTITGPVPGVRNQSSGQDAFYQMGSIGGIFGAGEIVVPFPYHESNVFEKNAATGGRHGIWAGDYASTVYRGNVSTVDAITTKRGEGEAFAPTSVYFRKQAQPTLIGNRYAGGMPVYSHQAASSQPSRLIPLFRNVSLTAVSGQVAQPLVLAIVCAGAADVSYTATATQPWIVLPHSSARIAAEQAGGLIVGASAATLSPGTYSDVIRLSDGARSVPIKVDLTVTPEPSRKSPSRSR
jgi:hypothetical protein